MLWTYSSIELYELLLRLVRDACIPRSQDDWGECAIDIECQQYPAADEVANLRQGGAREGVSHFKSIPARR